MNTKLTLRVNEVLVQQAKSEAKRRGKSVSQMFGEFIEGLSSHRQPETSFPPVTSSLVGILQGQKLSEEDYKRHLREKHL